MKNKGDSSHDRGGHIGIAFPTCGVKNQTDPKKSPYWIGVDRIEVKRKGGRDHHPLGELDRWIGREGPRSHMWCRCTNSESEGVNTSRLGLGSVEV